jgi:LacI family transcriptional regulator
MKANLQQISKLTGFSPATISNALNHKKGVKAETAEKIFATAEKLNYFAESKLSAIRFVQFKKNGRIVGQMNFFSEVISGVEQECRSHGYEAFLTTVSEESEDYHTQLQQILDDTTCGVIVLATEANEDDMALFAHAKAPLVILDNWPEKTPCNAVLISNTDSVCHAVEFLIRRGHRKIGYLKCSDRIKNFFYRQEGLYRALELNGLPRQERFEVELPPDPELAWHAMERFLDTNPELPTAYFADNDNIALGALRAFSAKGIRVPEDVSVIGFDDVPFARLSNPPLTTVRVPKGDMGRLAVRILLDHATSDIHTVTKTQIGTQLVERESVRTL